MPKGKEILEQLQRNLEFKLKQLEAAPWEIEHILHLHGQKCCSIVSMEMEPDHSLDDEFINAYVNEEKWVLHISYEAYAKKLFEENLRDFETKGYSPIKFLYLIMKRPNDWLEGRNIDAGYTK